MIVTKSIDDRFLNLLECPRDHSALHYEGEQLCCAKSHRYPVVKGIPVFLLAEKEQTIGIAATSLKAAESNFGDPLYIDTLGLSEAERRAVEREYTRGSKIDPAISYLIGATSGHGYLASIGRLEGYPIPDIPVGIGNGELLLDVGSNWGRWSVSAAQKGWRVVGIDPSLGALLAGQRTFSNMGLDIAFVCGDARFLPFKSDVFRCAFSYSVIQHLSENDAELCIGELRRVLRQGGVSKVQMAHRGGLRSTYLRVRRKHPHEEEFGVRYWSLASLRDKFETLIGPSKLVAEGFGGLGLLLEDRNYVSIRAKILIVISALLKNVSKFVRPLILFADSVYIISTKTVENPRKRPR